MNYAFVDYFILRIYSLDRIFYLAKIRRAAVEFRDAVAI